MSEFLPCPHCAGTDIRVGSHPETRSPTGAVYSMCCYACGATFPNRYKRELLVEAWNRRTPYVQGEGRIARLVREVEEMQPAELVLFIQAMADKFDLPAPFISNSTTKERQ